jgi:hypothetical protein
MHNLALGIGLILVATGIVAYVGSGAASWTALIPSVLGLIIAGLGGLALWRPGARTIAMHIAAVVALLGFLGSLQGVPEFFAMLGGTEVDRPWAAGAQTVTAIVTAVLVVAHVFTFLQARRAG